MNERSSHYVKAGKHEMHVSAWGNRNHPAVVLWHGLARTGRDFDELAVALSAGYLVLAPDTLGRGLSSWAVDPATDYSYEAYGEHVTAILEFFGVGNFRWVGTSMGGLLGVHMASGPMKDRISHLVVNDVGPWIPQEATGRIADYVGNPPDFATIVELEEWLRENYAPFGKNTDAFWRRMANQSCRRKDDGRITVHYDPQIVSQFTVHKADLDCWPQWDGLAKNENLKVMLLRGEDSDVLPKNVAEEMLSRLPAAKFHEFAECGHAPTLADEASAQLINGFLES